MKQELHNDCDGGSCVACARAEDRCENCNRLYGEKRELEQNQQALMDQCVKFENQIAQMMGTLSDQAATIRRLTEERLGPEKKNPERPAALYHLDEAYND